MMDSEEATERVVSKHTETILYFLTTLGTVVYIVEAGGYPRTDYPALIALSFGVVIFATYIAVPGLRRLERDANVR